MLKAVRGAAAEAGIWVHLGSLALAGAPGGKLANRGFVIDDEGAIRARYDKIHLFDVDLPTGESWRESASYRGGEHAVRGRDAGRAARPVDLLRSALRRSLSGAERSWRDRVQHSRPPSPCRPARRIGTCCCARGRSRRAPSSSPPRRSAATRTGATTYGHSLVVDPWGKVLLDMGGEAPGLGFAELDLGQVEEVRARLPAIWHRRPIPPPSASAMIIFDLKCAPQGHVFEAWFGSNEDYEAQAARGLVACPICGASEVDKAPMAPRVGAKGNQAADLPPAAVKAALAGMAEAQKQLLATSEHVGDRFPDEARAIHLGETRGARDPRPRQPGRRREPARRGHPDRAPALPGARSGHGELTSSGASAKPRGRRRAP